MKQRGFSLVELMITLVLGLLISGAIVQVMVSNQVTERLNRAIASAQEGGRFFIGRMRGDLMMAGLYDPNSPNLSRIVDIVDESAFLKNRPVILAGDFVNRPALGSEQGINGASDTLVVAFQGTRDCRGYKLGYAENEEFFVVNEYFLDGDSLKCRGFDGRVLRGQRIAVGNNGDAAFTLLDQVQSFQVQYGIADHQVSSNYSGKPVTYVTADQLPAMRLRNAGIVAIRIAVLVKGDGEVLIEPTPSFKLLNEDPVTPAEKRLFKKFESTISLRNVKNHMRSRKI
ncbi:PilW family protein [Bowmanella yangjiangensis]|uniref:PilW family protein n=1 Tax=Bowmanella yangjiangensis TaxID=2811230 RepID=A0ABS3D106_9ALTE|nr:PilW family protein [Bowmanella yangjiangensis]MBN7822046.1 PilW family protein [Bowmanella yangjiangensis]